MSKSLKQKKSNTPPPPAAETPKPAEVGAPMTAQQIAHQQCQAEVFAVLKRWYPQILSMSLFGVCQEDKAKTGNEVRLMCLQKVPDGVTAKGLKEVVRETYFQR